jgi:hypothetical protein
MCIGQHNDSRMNIALIMTAVRHGAVVANHCEVTELHKDSSGRLNGAHLKDNLTGKEWNIGAKVILCFSAVIRLRELKHYFSGNYKCHWPVL